nr:DNA-directed RNA polymerase III subunit RPC6-like [Tanacetum cinerariifolium]
MSKSRKGPTQPAPLTPHDQEVLNLIKGKGDQAILVNNIPRETGLSPPIVTKCIKTVLSLKLIKEVKNVRHGKGKYYIGAEFTPTADFTGGSWYVDGKLDKAFIDQLKEICYKILTKQLRVATSEGMYDYLRKRKVIDNGCTSGQISEILRCMVFENTIIEVKSTGLEEYHLIPVGNVCYSAVQDQAPKIGAMVSIPC